MVLYNVLFDLDSAIADSSREMAGLYEDSNYTTAKYRSMPENCDACHSANDGTSYVHEMQNITQTNCDACHAPIMESASGSAVDQISVLNVVSPDLMKAEWVNSLYSPIASVAMTLFSTLLLIAAIAYIWSLINEDYVVGSEMWSVVKRSFVEIPAICFGVEIFAMMLTGNTLLSYMFSDTVNVGSLCMAGLMDPSGLIVLAYAVGTVLTAWFYMCRYFIIILTLMLWPIGCIMRIFTVSRSTGLLILRITGINIFLGSWMCACYAAGAWITTVGPNGVFVSWGSTVVGVVVMFGALWLPRKLWNSQIGNGLGRTSKKAVTYVKMVV